MEAWAQGGKNLSWQDTSSLLTIWCWMAGPLRLAQKGSGALLDQSNVVPKIQ